MNQKHRQEEKESQARREREHALRVEGAEQAFESYREALRAVTSGGKIDATEAIQGFDELIALARMLGREEERRRKKLYTATVSYGVNKTVVFGPTSSRDRADALAKSWMDGHAGLFKAEPVKGVKLEAVDHNGVKVAEGDDEDEDT